MIERELAFSTFLKLLELDPPQKHTTLKGFMRGGGFNYWKPLQNLTPDVFAKKPSIDELHDWVAKMAKSHQRKYNAAALTNVLKWVSRRKVTWLKRPPKIVKKFGNSGLKVRLEPEACFKMDGRKYLMHIWATTKPRLSEETISMGLHFARHHNLEEGNDAYQFLFFDTIKDKVFGEVEILQNAGQMLGEQRVILENLWSEVSEPKEDSSSIEISEQEEADIPF